MNRKKSQIIKFQLSLILAILCISISSYAQQDFSAFFRESDPARDTIDLETKISIHKNYLGQAIKERDTISMLLGYLYLANDNIRTSNTVDAMEYLLDAEKVATLKKDTLILGRINHKKGAVYSTLKNYNEAIEKFKIGFSQSTIAKDSVYMAISMEQIGRKYANLKDYDASNEYYEIALPLVRKHCRPNALTTTLINYGNSLDEQGETEKAISTYKEAIRIGEEIEDEYEIIPAKQNLALVYANSNSLYQALDLYYECLEANIRNGWMDFLIYTYDGLSYTYEKLGNMDSTFYYSKKYYQLKDSIIGGQVQSQVLNLEAEAKMYEKDIQLLNQEKAALEEKQKFRNIIYLSLLTLTFLAFSSWYYFYNARKARIELRENLESLKEMTKILATKNAEIRDLKNIKEIPIDNTHLDINYYDITILTESDWLAFKGLFEKSYPNYINKIRQHFPDISPAEERLFTFIKLQISTKESANILGVQVDTVKKTRSRLRKRIKIEKEENLNDFIKNF